jgi:hypothetical protein
MTGERLLCELRGHARAMAAAARDRGDDVSAERWSRLAELWDTDRAAAVAHLFRTDWARRRDDYADVDDATAAAFDRLYEGGGDDAA